eukprot:CAMPEP_0175738804 /NCGR_PEP_ID=MMETSP0097-20121207/54666_1 /TAXON_ID=311494 /ORGANISM="Alexandrium monilatum, Strain CCMP3105" /LENGTH=51 /DNA_ID=CAMNT_0017047025 /DNA_START=72 /DNA_END=227 /DNA_ORIENTATION=-
MWREGWHKPAPARHRQQTVRRVRGPVAVVPSLASPALKLQVPSEQAIFGET